MTPGEKKFVDAALKGDATIIWKLLKTGVDNNAKDTCGLPHPAAGAGGSRDVGCYTIFQRTQMRRRKTLERRDAAGINHSWFLLA